MINNVDQLNEAILTAYEYDSVGFCYDPAQHNITFYDGVCNVTLTINITPLIEQGVDVDNVKIHTDGALTSLKTIHEEDIIP